LSDLANWSFIFSISYFVSSFLPDSAGLALSAGFLEEVDGGTVASATGADGVAAFVSSGATSLSVTIEKSPLASSFFSAGFGSSFFSTGFGSSFLISGFGASAGFSSDLTYSGSASPEVSIEKSP
jgi:hypothetical protein